MQPLPDQRHRSHRLPRIVATLTFPEIIVIWALRHATADAGGGADASGRIAKEFARALGLARLEDALAALATMVAALADASRLPQAMPPLDDDRVSAREEALLALLGAAQRSDPSLSKRLVEWLVLPSAQRDFAEAAASLARIMSEAGQTIPLDSQRHRPRLRLAACYDDDAAPHKDRLPPAADWQTLSPPERHLTGGVRLWVQAFRSDQDPLAAVRLHFGSRASADAGLSLHAVLRNTTLAATRAVDVRCLRCPGLSPDEARLLDAIAWLQREQTEAAAAALAHWLPGAALRLSLDAARGLGAALAQDGYILPLRDWDYAALEAASRRPHRPHAKEAAQQGAAGPNTDPLESAFAVTGGDRTASPTVH
ncbi:hypothetical protein [Pelagibius sp.]|uniref:hypothetical protein n=1 Tax=Pelagibius sp. TaxID=1931238 RepID=UPI002618B714|nr:hypothetical protein [Pelagibius sp.]